MPLPAEARDAALPQVERFCDEQIPEDAREQTRLEASVEGTRITIKERRPPWREDLGRDWTSQPIAQLRYDSKTRSWALY